MPTSSTHAPQHRNDDPRPHGRTAHHDPVHRSTTHRVARRVLRHGLVAATAVAVSGATVGSVLVNDDGVASTRSAVEAASAGDALSEVASDEDFTERITARDDGASRSDRREARDPAKAAALAPRDAQAVTRTENVVDQDPKTVARSLMGEYGFSSSEFGCLEQLWEKESGWSTSAANPTSSAYGIPQALPGSKMASAGSDWERNPVTQIRWGLGYIDDRYGSPCAAWSHSQSNNWY